MSNGICSVGNVCGNSLQCLVDIITISHNTARVYLLELNIAFRRTTPSLCPQTYCAISDYQLVYYIVLIRGIVRDQLY